MKIWFPRLAVQAALQGRTSVRSTFDKAVCSEPLAVCGGRGPMGIEWQVWAGSGLEEVGIGQNRLRNSSYEHFYVGC